MRTKTVKRHYCDFCSKGMFKESAMRDHEFSCTKNPNRKCFLCENEGRDYPDIAKRLLALPGVSYSEWVDESVANTSSPDPIHWLTSMCDGCPACMLAALQQSKLMAFEHFDYKEAVRNWHAEKGREQRDMLMGADV